MPACTRKQGLQIMLGRSKGSDALRGRIRTTWRPTAEGSALHCGRFWQKRCDLEAQPVTLVDSLTFFRREAARRLDTTGLAFCSSKRVRFLFFWPISNSQAGALSGLEEN